MRIAVVALLFLTLFSCLYEINLRQLENNRHRSSNSKRKATPTKRGSTLPPTYPLLFLISAKHFRFESKLLAHSSKILFHFRGAKFAALFFRYHVLNNTITQYLKDKGYAS